jgi:hypothetical protein
VTRIAITGHRGLSEQVSALIGKAVRSALSRFDPAGLVGISCLADGADQIFAQAVLDHGGALEVIVPASAYRDALPEEARLTYDELLHRATTVRLLDHQESTSSAHMDASENMLQNADHLFAVWDGKPARGFGGTADVVDHARSIGIPVTVFWPDGAVRDGPAYTS